MALWARACRDKFCIDQSDITRALKCLPVFVFSCKRLMILAGNTYCDRLWCIWELFAWPIWTGPFGRAQLAQPTCLGPFGQDHLAEPCGAAQLAVPIWPGPCGRARLARRI